MVTVDLVELPGSLQRIAASAIAVGWAVTATVALGPPQTVALRFGHDTFRAYGVWTLEADGKRIGWRAGAFNGGGKIGHCDTLKALKVHLGVAS